LIEYIYIKFSHNVQNTYRNATNKRPLLFYAHPQINATCKTEHIYGTAVLINCYDK